ncbi:DNA-processing protein DprA [Ottowia thiooxydans]|uniref:DNA-processing protein DprA n=1 Tax=Ottowia thiooxydans TaxID=219182 RepID=UPI000490E0E0|nr:DNA-processing protein DprA [Ottowia thiooxydans]
MEREELAAWLRLEMTSGVGNDSARRLLAAFGLPQAIFEQSKAVLGQFVSAAQASALTQEPPQLAEQVQTTLDWLAGAEDGPPRRVVTLGDADYPDSLLTIEDPPLMLYLLGQVADWPLRALAMVGTRNPTPQGSLNAQQFAHAFGRAGLTIVSGLALGVDGAAHTGALEGHQASPEAHALATIAIVGTGLDRVYPRQHRDLAHRIARQGLIVSEYRLGTPPLPANFPKRNRLISGLTRGTLVVEAALRSGSLITARLASEQGKEVFAIPGSIHGTQSRGCHSLIKQGAKLVESAQDVLEELHWPVPKLPRVAQEATPVSGSNEDGLLQALGADPASLDALQARTGFSTSLLQTRLLELELDGRVGRLPGGLFQRLGQA